MGEPLHGTTRRAPGIGSGVGSAPYPHDRIIKLVAARAHVHAAYVNAGGHRNACITVHRQELYPDLVLCDRESFRIEHVVEVETAETISEERAHRWRHEASGPWRFWLVVPRRALAAAAQLCRRFGVRAHLLSWTLGADGGIEIAWPTPAFATQARI